MLLKDIQWKNKDVFETDIAIVGGGAAGISLALSLSKSGISVVLLEGGLDEYSDNSQDIYRGSYDQRNLPYGLAGSRLRFFGGSTNCWAGGCGELDAEDFYQRSWVPNSGWPITKKELSYFYSQAADFLGINLDLLSRPQQDARIPSLAGFDLRILEFTNKIRFTSEFKDSIAKSEDLLILLGANLTRIERSDNGQNISALEIQSFNGAKSKVKAKAYVLACGGLENPRILLNSQDTHFSALGNSNDLVGRFFSDHPIAPCAGVIGPEGPLRTMRQDATKFFENLPGQKNATIPFYRLPFSLQKEYETLNGTVQFYTQEQELGVGELAAWKLKNYFSDRENNKITSQDILDVASHPYDIYKAWKERRAKSDSRIAMRFQIEQAPNYSNRVSLSDQRDSFGLRRINLSWNFGIIERRTVDILMAYAAKCLQTKEIGTLKLDLQLYEKRKDLPRDLRGGQHHCGTTRMGESPQKGVVDKNLKVFGTNNLYVCGSSVFPTNGWVNPTFTILALSLRLAEHLRAHALGAP
ncbi:GMC family oxidoreductase [Polynucleobacter paneuropaeus]|nr:GMC family oxidoreductase [Polynucleobacter paneuropaeus]